MGCISSRCRSVAFGDKQVSTEFRAQRVLDQFENLCRRGAMGRTRLNDIEHAAQGCPFVRPPNCQGAPPLLE